MLIDLSTRPDGNLIELGDHFSTLRHEYAYLRSLSISAHWVLFGPPSHYSNLDWVSDGSPAPLERQRPLVLFERVVLDAAPIPSMLINAPHVSSWASLRAPSICYVATLFLIKSHPSLSGFVLFPWVFDFHFGLLDFNCLWAAPIFLDVRQAAFGAHWFPILSRQAHLDVGLWEPKFQSLSSPWYFGAHSWAGRSM